MFPPPVIITACPRSGSSMIAGVLNICGAFGGEKDGSDRLYENIKIRERILIPYLKSLYVDPDGQYPLPNTNKLTIPTDLRSQTIEILKQDGYQSGIWLLKGARFCITWPIWHYAFPNAKWIIVRRRTGDVINSCIKTDFMRAFKNEDNCKAVGADNEAAGWKSMINKYNQNFRNMIEAGLNVKVLWPERMVTGDYVQMFETVDWAGLNWKSEALTWIDSKLAKTRKKLEYK